MLGVVMANIVILMMLLSFPQALPGQQKDQASSRSAAVLRDLQEKDLFKLAETSLQAKNSSVAFDAFVAAFEKRQQKPHKKYSPMFESVSLELALAEAAKGRENLAAEKLAICERQIVAAQDRLKPLGLKSAEVNSLTQSFNEKVAGLRSRLEKAKAQAVENDFEGSLSALHSLEANEKYVPDLKNTIAQTERLHLEFLVASAQKSCAARNWDEASSLYQRVQQKDPANAAVKPGSERIDRGRLADSLRATALKQLSSGELKEAMRSIEKAISSDPEFSQLQETKTQVVERWIQTLGKTIPSLLSNKSDFVSTRDGYLGLETLRTLKPDHQLIKETLEEASRTFAGNSLERANQISQDPSKALAATAYTLFLSAKARSQPGFVQEDDLKNAASYFNRKRFGRVVVSVENESSAPESFVNSIRTRAINTVENLGLSDLRVLPREQYNASGEADAVFGNLRVDGMPSTVMLTIRIDKHFSDLETSEKLLESEYLFQTKEVANPAHEKKAKEQDQFWEEERKGLRKVKDSDRLIVRERQQKELDAIPRMIPEPDLRKYNYRQITHTRATQVTLVLSFKDPLINEPITTDRIDYPNTNTKIEIAGAQEKDTRGVLNQPLVAFLTKEQALNQTERLVATDFELKLPKMLAPFTDRFLTEGKKRMASGQVSQAVEDFLCHWAITKGRVASAEDADRIPELVKQETAYDLRRFNQDFFSLITILRQQ
jgi:tetratricopeptide (TPR) repeat protein